MSRVLYFQLVLVAHLLTTYGILYCPLVYHINLVCSEPSCFHDVFCGFIDVLFIFPGVCLYYIRCHLKEWKAASFRFRIIVEVDVDLAYQIVTTKNEAAL